MMKKFLMVMLVPILVISVSCSAKPRTPEEILADVHKTIDSIETYRVTLNATMPPHTQIITTVWGKVPDRLFLEMEVNVSVPEQDNQWAYLKMVFDGEYKWTEAFARQGNDIIQPKTVQKNRLIDAAEVESPFDPFYYLYEVDVLKGLDLPASIKNLIKLYDFKTVRLQEIDGVKCEVLEGEVNEAAFRELGIMDSIRLYFAKEDHFIRKYEIGPDLDNPAFLAVFSQIKLNPELPKDIFVYTPPEGVKVQDIGGAVEAGSPQAEEIREQPSEKPPVVSAAPSGEPELAPRTEIAPTAGQWGIQLIYYKNSSMGKHLSKQMIKWLKEHDVYNVFARVERIQGNEMISVYAGPYDSKDEVQKLLPDLKAKRRAFKGSEIIKFK